MNEQLDHAPFGYIEFSEDGKVLASNTTLANLLGYSPEELVGRKFESLLTLANKIFYQTHFFPLLKLNGNASEVFLSLLGRDGSSIPVLTSAGRRNGSFQCAFMVVSERQKYETEILSARRKAEEALSSNEELKKAKQELEQNARDLDRRLHELQGKNLEVENVSRLLAHDLREPVRKVRLFADLVRENVTTALDAEGSFGLTRIFEESDRALHLITEIQRFLDAGTSQEAMVPVELDSVVRGAEQMIREKNSNWKLEVENLPKIVGRPRQLESLFQELFDNALKFCPLTHPLVVRISSQKIQLNGYHATKDRYVYRDFVQIEVADNGMSFDPQYTSYVFGLFKKLNPTSNGVGAGLAICRKIAATHQGTIEIRPVLNQGTSVILRLPYGE
jgi:phosphoserine phosphatase RsbU/P